MKEKLKDSSTSSSEYASIKRPSDSASDFEALGYLASSLDGSKKAERIVPLLVRYINQAKLKAGDKMPSEQQLCQEIGVGRRALRESLICLQSIGLIQSRHGMGWYVEQFDPSTSLRFLSPLLQDFGGADLHQVLQTRLAIEPMIVQLASRHITEAGLQRLLASLHVMEKHVDNPDAEEFRINDRKFHDILAQECGNCVLSMISSILTGLFYSVLWDLPQDNKGNVLQKHQILYEAVRNHDSPLAIQTIKDHLEEAMVYIDKHYHKNRVPQHENNNQTPQHENNQPPAINQTHLKPSQKKGGIKK
jgi:GntR family transcriptional regulator, transcriptional repressor for pyruvate dehydrogenase complex